MEFNNEKLVKLGLLARKLTWQLRKSIGMDDFYTCGCAVASYTMMELMLNSKKLLSTKKYNHATDWVSHGKEKISMILGEYEESNHCWIQYGKKIIDPTATQFGDFPEVTILTPKSEDYDKYMIRFSDQDAFDDLMYWERQSPFRYIKEITNFVKKNSYT